MKKISIIIVTYNALEHATKPCIESLLGSRSDMSYEVIIVDNNSTDGTIEFLKELENKNSSIKVIYNKENTGFAAGNNIGIKYSQSDYYILLNSDTLTNDYWIDSLVDFMEQNPHIGIAGPVSNCVPTEQCIYIQSGDEEQIIKAGKQWADKNKGYHFPTDMLSFFCVIIRNQVIEKVGLLDERYGKGMFEDDDYCMRTVLAGYKLACYEGVFIFHKGSVSFKQDYHFSRNRNFLRNKKRFEKKFNTKWKSRNNINSFLDLIHFYLACIYSENSILIKEKIENRLKSIENFEILKMNSEFSGSNYALALKLFNKVLIFFEKTGVIGLFKSILALKRKLFPKK